MGAGLADLPEAPARGGAPASGPAPVKRGGRDALAIAAAGLLLVTLLWRVVLVTWLPAPVRARELLASPAGTSGSGWLVLLVDAPGTPASSEAADRARRAWPGFPLDVHAAGLQGAAPERLRSLARSYGYSRLPLLLTLDPDGHVVRIAPM